MAAVLQDNMLLPGNNENIDLVLDANESSKKKIAKELEKFFENPKYYLEMLRKSKEDPVENNNQDF